ncbi:MAG: DUF4365 domain-containing protein [Chloroflexi bacterium]|nr:DUF4365 domain-containing protein [Chloroflexota bacterium]
MSTALRYTPQKQQELRSRHQLSERLTDFGWLPTVPEDLGEDFIVHIYHEGRATGVNFYVQLKSVTNLNKRRKGDSLPYPFKVKDLVHWEQFALPVVLIIWDVKLREGRWAMLNEIIQQLDQHYPNWRTQKTKTVHIPWHNNMDEDGLIKLRKAIGKKIYPLISAGKLQDTQVTLTFNTQNNRGRKNLEKFNYHLDSGKEVTLNNINAQFDFPKLQQIWLDMSQSGHFDITLGSRTSQKEFTIDISIADSLGQLHFLYPMKFRAIAIGKKTITITNKHQFDASVHFEFTFDHPNELEQKLAKTTASIRRNNFGSNVLQTKKILKFMQILANGGNLTLTFRELNDNSLLLVSPPRSKIMPNPKFVALVEKLCMIQQETGHLFKVPDEGFYSDDVEAINEFFVIIRQGKITNTNQSYTVEFLNQNVLIGNTEENFLNILLNFRKQNLPIQFTFTFEDSEFHILNRTIKTGLKVRHLVCNITTPASTLKNALKTLGSDEALEVHFDDVEETIIFPDWFTREANRISHLLADKFMINKIYLFGSLAWGNTFSPETDIDLAVSGLDPEQLFKAIGYLEQETNYPFDLVDLDSVPESLQERIFMEGKLLYEREPLAVSG